MKVIDHMILCHGKLNCYYDRILITLGYWAIVGVKRMHHAQSFTEIEGVWAQVAPIWLYFITTNGLPRGKTNNVVSEQVLRKLRCTRTEEGWRLETDLWMGSLAF